MIHSPSRSECRETTNGRLITTTGEELLVVEDFRNNEEEETRRKERQRSVLDPRGGDGRVAEAVVVLLLRSGDHRLALSHLR